MISVIVPVYNVEKYLDKCVQSILAQTYKDFELILVDDGSPDNCPQMCDQFAKNDSRIRVLHKKNGGLSDARNAGTAIASGEFVTYVDSDDYVADDYLEKLHSLLEKYDADIAVTGVERYYGSKPNCKNEKENEYCYSGVEALEKMLYQDTLDSSACAILLPKVMALNNLFPIGKYHEDEFTTYKYYSEARKVAVTTRKQYFYFQRPGSIMHIFGQSAVDELDASDNLVHFCKNNYPNMEKAAKSKKFSNYCQVLLKNTNINNDNYKEYKRIIHYIDNVKFDILFDNKTRRKNRIAALLLIFGEGILRFVWETIVRVRKQYDFLLII